MDASFWEERWREGRIGFHEGRPNALLARHRDQLPGRRVLVPLCGKAVDLAYLAGDGHEVVGIELVEDAVRAFFAEHGLAPTVTRAGDHAVYAAGAVTLIAGDLFGVTRGLLDATGGPVEAIYDRAALIALAPDARARYLDHLRALSAPGTPGLLITLEHATGSGPPWSIPADVVRALYPHARHLEAHADPGAMQGRGATEHAFAITL